MIRRALTSILALTAVVAAMLLVPTSANAHPGHDHSGRASGHIFATAIPAGAKVTHADGGAAGSAQAAPCARASVVAASVVAASFAKDRVVAASFIAAPAILTAAGPRASALGSLAAPSTDSRLRHAIALMAGACTGSGCTGSGCTGPSCCPGGACPAGGGLTAEAETDPRPPLAAIRSVSTPEAIRPGTASGGLERPPRSLA